MTSDQAIMDSLVVEVQGVGAILGMGFQALYIPIHISKKRYLSLLPEPANFLPF